MTVNMQYSFTVICWNVVFIVFGCEDYADFWLYELLFPERCGPPCECCHCFLDTWHIEIL